MEYVAINSSLQQAIRQSEAAVVLLGVADGEVTLVGCGFSEAITTDLQDVLDVLPWPVTALGAYAPSKEEASRKAAELCRSGFHANGCVAVYPDEEGLIAMRVRSDGTLGPSLQLKQLATTEEWLQRYCIFRTEMTVGLEVVEDSQPAQGAGLQAAVQRLIRQLEAPGAMFAADTGSASGRVLIRPDSSASVDSLPSKGGSGGAVVQCTLLQDTTCLADPPAGPAFTYRPLAAGGGAAPASASCRSTTLRLDALSYVPRSCPLSQAAAALQAALVRQLHAAQRLLAKQGAVLPVRAYHFLPPGFGHHLTIMYPSLVADAELNDAKLLSHRQRLHALWGLPANRPLLRPANAVDMAAAAEAGEDASGGAVARLQDVHMGLVVPGIGGTVTLVQGSYEYCHYMQDRFNDSGWGCAYRSLQTICSWFRLQKYTTKPIPSHKTVQQVLARLGDKPPSFVGSSNWIGAIELSYVLDDYLGVTSKILTVNRGADIPAHARELAAHFATVGSPVMIGGGVLAYTLLGVRFNEQTGEAAFLILDPHYTGGEDIKKIHQGTWVGWKRPGDNAAAGGPLFVADAFYNFLMPQRPNTV
ncbi:hypothetical protein GPECTOR_1g919 [Gonium pectorale]|uniref:Ufm1-specific protease n=1 Tax=Gonium pectorale TaxID=33097 RepID=A0A150H4F9_GONPE|nr:hypothetical protein GPECTOR_1g919 [Gonium pectorale]|eukprot:KXZ57017.1 hypothetical protein GPECTOR_1g919 [Gonium pectorale]